MVESGIPGSSFLWSVVGFNSSRCVSRWSVAHVTLCVCLSVSLSVSALWKKSTINAILATHILYGRISMHWPRGQRSMLHRYENCHGRTVVKPAALCCSRVLLLLLPAWGCMSVRLPTFSIVSLQFSRCSADRHMKLSSRYHGLRPGERMRVQQRKMFAGVRWHVW